MGAEHQKHRKLSLAWKKSWMILATVSVLVVSLISLWMTSSIKIGGDQQILWKFPIAQENSGNCDYRNYILGPNGEQNDPCLIDVVRDKLLFPPSPFPYQTTSKEDGGDDLPAVRLKNWILEELLKGQEVKFFIECGANNGQHLSTTLTLERLHGWKGLLIEADPKAFRELTAKNRKAWSINAAACTTNYAEKLIFYTHPQQTVLGSLTSSRFVNQKITVQCVPMYAILQALGVSVVDYLSLDVEGAELSVLKTIPFDKITFKVLAVEHAHIPGKRPALQEFLKSKGYFFLREVVERYTEDSIFLHESLRETSMTLNVTGKTLQDFGK